MTIGNINNEAMILGPIKYPTELTPITSNASICSVTRIVPSSEAIFEPTLPANIREIIVGQNLVTLTVLQ